MVSQLIFKSFIYFEFILVHGVGLVFCLFVCFCMYNPVLPTPFIQVVIFTSLYAFASFVKY